mgnify:CR=1 FL=1
MRFAIANTTDQAHSTLIGSRRMDEKGKSERSTFVRDVMEALAVHGYTAEDRQYALQEVTVAAQGIIARLLAPAE